MFRLLRTLILLAFAFVAGMMFERDNPRKSCEGDGGLWINQTCVGSEFNQ